MTTVARKPRISFQKKLTQNKLKAGITLLQFFILYDFFPGPYFNTITTVLDNRSGITNNSF